MTDPKVIAQEIVDTYLAGTDENEEVDPNHTLVEMIARALAEARVDGKREAERDLEGKM